MSTPPTEPAHSAESDALVPCVCGEQNVHPYPNDTGDHSTTECPIPPAMARPLPLHRTEAGYPRCSTCDGAGCPDCTDPA